MNNYGHTIRGSLGLIPIVALQKRCESIPGRSGKNIRVFDGFVKGQSLSVLGQRVTINLSGIC